MGQAPWKQQQRSSAFKWIKSPAQSPGPAGIGQNGCSLDEDLRLIIYGAAFVFAATIAYMGNTVQYMRICVLVHTSGETGISYSSVHIVVVVFSPSVLNLLLKISYQVCCAAAVERFLSSESIPADCLCLVCCHAACLIYALI